ncbi:MAG: deoxyribonuclease IV [Defluviitaleaceae bacterium]|nr:deoxyribonuclease IV [Defluviitaleaceae bacterium]
MFKIGCHLSTSKGYLAMGKEAVSIAANTFQYFSRNPRGGAVKPLNLEDIQNFNAYSQEHGLHPPLAHAPYTLNPCAQKPNIREFALMVMKDDIERLEHIPGSLYNFHPGSHVQQGVSVGIELIANTLNQVLDPNQNTLVLLETMAGKGTEIGRSFEELRQIIDKVEHNKLMGVCLDTCHVYDAGYDIVQDLDGVLEDFDNIIGLQRLKAVHINDSKNPIKSHKDRHEKIGKGHIGMEAFERIINHPALVSLPFYLETPNDVAGYAEEIAALKNRRHK